MELQVIQPNVSLFKFNEDELKKVIQEKKMLYADIAYTEDTMTDARKDLAALRKDKASVNEVVKKVKRKYEKPFVDFKNRVDSITQDIDDVINQIDQEVKEFDKQKKEEKKAKIIQIYQEYIQIPVLFDDLFNQKWLNKTYTLKKIKEEMLHFQEVFQRDLETIMETCDFKEEAAAVYSSTRDIAKALKRNQELIEMKSKVEKMVSKPDKFMQPAAQTGQMKDTVRPSSPTRPTLPTLTFEVTASPTEINDLLVYMKEKKLNFKKVN